MNASELQGAGRTHILLCLISRCEASGGIHINAQASQKRAWAIHTLMAATPMRRLPDRAEQSPFLGRAAKHPASAPALLPDFESEIGAAYRRFQRRVGCGVFGRAFLHDLLSADAGLFGAGQIDLVTMFSGVGQNDHLVMGHL